MGEVSKFNMDLSNASSEIIDSLDILRPPVKRIPDKTWKSKEINTDTIIQTQKGEISDYIPNYKTYSTIKVSDTCSTSLIKNSLLERKIHERYSIVSYTTLLHPTCRKDHIHKYLNEDKPLIKITVIPKIKQTQTGKLKRKPAHDTKRIHKTVSNHDNSVQPKKLFVIVTGQKEKIYEIKPSGSTHLTRGQIENKSVNEKNIIKGITNIRDLIKSLDMDKNKNVNKNNKINTKHTFEFDEIAKKSSLFKKCKCKEFSGYDVDRNINAQASRVRISGCVGFNEDEKYILNCTATVDNKPITTNISKAIGNGSSHVFYQFKDEQPKYVQNDKTCSCVTGCNKFNMYKSQKDSNIQVDLVNVNSNLENISRNGFKSKKSQSTQVNFNIQLPNIDALRTLGKNEINQCDCKHLNNAISTIGKETEENTLRAHHSPLVIISVYPKQDTYETTKIQQKPALEDSGRTQRFGKYVSNTNSKQPDKNQGNYIRSGRATPRPSRSPSPIKNCCVQSNKNNRQFETLIAQTTKRKESPLHGKFNDVTNKIVHNKETTKFNKTNTCTSQKQDKMNCVLKTREPKSVQAQLKKTLVEDYTKILTGNKYDNFNNNDSKNRNSRVNIKIDSDSGNYDMLLSSGKLKNDLRIRKTVKETGSQKYDCHRSSRKNCSFVSTTSPTRRNISPVKQIYQSNGVLDFPNHTPTLKARDSIEIFHRRETGHRIKDAGTHQTVNDSDYNKHTESFAPIKHYTGDNCKLPNPVDRDKEIRELLGVVNRIPSTSKQEHNLGSVSEDLNTIKCFYEKTCNKNFETEVNQYKLYPCCCMNVNKNEQEKHSGDNDNEYPQKDDEIESSRGETSLYQQLILNRNIQVFLQVEQFSKQKPIVLSRKQYNKVKRTIQKTISKRINRNKRKNSIISIGEIRKRIKPEGRVDCKYTKYTQTKKSVTLCNGGNKEYRNKNPICSHRKCFEQSQVQTIVLFDSNKTGRGSTDIGNKAIDSEKRTVSSLQIHYKNIEYVKSDTFSSTNVESLSSTSFNKRNNSLYTLFKGQRKIPTPNLGTSVFSLLTNTTKLKSKYFENSSSSTPDIKAKKPFLRRLMSCLVMQSRISKKVPIEPATKSPSNNSSVDSYHINTSLGPIEMTSSVYDTSTSFYSDHAICPIVNNKMKRGFFSSVRGFLTSR